MPAMIPTPRLTLLFITTALAVVLAAAPADAAKRRVPFGFFGTVVSPTMANAGVVPDAVLDQQMALMARSGVESVRIVFAWEELEPQPGAYDFTAIDRLVATAARHGLASVVNVTATPRWASIQASSEEYWRFPPSSPQPFAEHMRQLVLRYGPRGSLWAQNPSLPVVPVRQWQIWNEQTAPWHWNPQPWAPGYTQLLRAAYRAIRGADPRAKVVAGSLVAPRADYPPADAIRDLYRAGAKRFFDAVAVHPFTNDRRSVRRTVDQILAIVRGVRAEMKRRGDGRKPIILTELMWPASAGMVPTEAQLGFETTPRGQAARLKASYRALARARRELRVTQAYWYNWASEYDNLTAPSVMTFRYTGLTRVRSGVFSRKPILGTYANLAARYEGCRKSANARRCR